jgi:putative Mn2+ efflux pump MntP
MSLAELFLIGVSLSMDAFAVSVAKGLKMPRINYRHGFIIALFFGGFQALMPFLGWLLGSSFSQYIERFDHWIAFGLLALIGGKMIYETLRGGEEEEEETGDRLDIKELTLMSVATSIDALAVGISFAILPDTNIGLSVLLIGCTTFAISLIGVIVGNRFGAKYQSKAELLGGIVLVLIGLKILLEHLGILVL